MLRNKDHEFLKAGLDIQATQKTLITKITKENDRGEEAQAIKDNQRQIEKIRDNEVKKTHSKTNYEGLWFYTYSIAQRAALQKEWDRNEKVGDLKKAILNRKIKPYNIESHLNGLVSPMTAKEYKQLVGGSKQDLYKQFFVETNKPISVLPTDSSFKLAYNFAKREDHEMINTDTMKLNRRSCGDLKTIGI